MKELETAIKKLPTFLQKVCGLEKEVKDLDVGVSAIGIETFRYNPTTSQLTIGFKISDGTVRTISTPIVMKDFKPDIVVNTYSDLSSITNPTLFEFVEVRNSQGTRYLPGSLGGTYYGSGLYYWNGTEWKHDNDKVYKALQDLTGLLATKANVNHTHVKADITDFNEADYLKTLADLVAVRPLKTINGESIEGVGNIVISGGTNVQGTIIRAGQINGDVSQTLYEDTTNNLTISWDGNAKQPTYTVSGWGWHDATVLKIDGSSTAIRVSGEDISSADGTFYFSNGGTRNNQFDMENWGSYFKGTLMKESGNTGTNRRPTVIVEITMGNVSTVSYLIHVIQ